MKLRNALNQLIKPFGYKIIKPDWFKEELIREYNESHEFYFIQIGAHDGIKYDDLYSFVAKHSCRVTFPHFMNKLKVESFCLSGVCQRVA